LTAHFTLKSRRGPRQLNATIPGQIGRPQQYLAGKTSKGMAESRARLTGQNKETKPSYGPNVGQVDRKNLFSKMGGKESKPKRHKQSAILQRLKKKKNPNGGEIRMEKGPNARSLPGKGELSRPEKKARVEKVGGAQELSPLHSAPKGGLGSDLASQENRKKLSGISRTAGHIVSWFLQGKKALCPEDKSTKPTWKAYKQKKKIVL